MIFSHNFGDHNKGPDRGGILLTDFDLELRPDFMIRFNRKQMVRDAKVKCKRVPSAVCHQAQQSFLVISWKSLSKPHAT